MDIGWLYSAWYGGSLPDRQGGQRTAETRSGGVESTWSSLGQERTNCAFGSGPRGSFDIKMGIAAPSVSPYEIWNSRGPLRVQQGSYDAQTDSVVVRSVCTRLFCILFVKDRSTV